MGFRVEGEVGEQRPRAAERRQRAQLTRDFDLEPAEHPDAKLWSTRRHASRLTAVAGAPRTAFITLREETRRAATSNRASGDA